MVWSEWKGKRKIERERERGEGRIREQGSGRGQELAKPASVAKNRNETRLGEGRLADDCQSRRCHHPPPWLACSLMIILVLGALVVEGSRFPTWLQRQNKNQGQIKLRGEPSCSARISLASLSSML